MLFLMATFLMIQLQSVHKMFLVVSVAPLGLIVGGVLAILSGFLMEPLLTQGSTWGVALFLGIDRFMSEARALTNVTPGQKALARVVIATPASTPPTISTGLRPYLSLAQAERGVAAAMNSTAKHSRPRKVSRV